MHVHFYDEPNGGPKAKDEVRFNRLGLYMYPEKRQVAVGFDITPFFEKPSIEVTITNDQGERAASLSVIEAMQPNFSLIMHLRDQVSTDTYQVEAILYYPSVEAGRQVVHQIEKGLDATQEGEQ
ncbi:MAG: hypothetical protein WAM60_19800 [Candidatus Promineifilaceae bacterium]